MRGAVCVVVVERVVLVRFVVVVVLVDVVGELVVVLVLGELVVVLVAGLQDSDRALSPAGTGIADSGVPGATLTAIGAVRPFGCNTMTVHVSADAAGSSAIACTASAVPTVEIVIRSFRRLNTLGYLLPPSCARN